MAKRVTLADVAARAGLSKTAVSLILNDRPGSRLSAEAVQRVRAATRELNYRPNPAARSLRLGTTATVGFISNQVTVTRYASAMIRGALDVAEEMSHAVLIAETGDAPEQVTRAMQLMTDRHTDGIIIASMNARMLQLPGPPDPADLPGLAPVVINLNVSTNLSSVVVLPSEYEAGYAITRELLDHGHRDGIAVLGNSLAAANERTVSVTLGERFRGIWAALDEADVQPCAVIDIDEWEPANGYHGMHRILASTPPLTAVLCLNDRLAFGAYQALQEAHLRIPQDVSVASFDDDEIAAYLRPGLTTARIPYEEMGRQAMRLCLTSPAHPATHLVTMPIQRRHSISAARTRQHAAPARRPLPMPSASAG